MATDEDDDVRRPDFVEPADDPNPVPMPDLAPLRDGVRVSEFLDVREPAWDERVVFRAPERRVEAPFRDALLEASPGRTPARIPVREDTVLAFFDAAVALGRVFLPPRSFSL